MPPPDETEGSATSVDRRSASSEEHHRAELAPAPEAPTGTATGAIDNRRLTWSASEAIANPSGWMPVLREYTNAAELDAWLQQSNVNTSKWTGRDGVGHVGQLFEEVFRGETELIKVGSWHAGTWSGRVERRITHVEVRLVQARPDEMQSIQNVDGAGYLVETMRIHPNGKHEPHRAPIRTVLSGGESPMDAARRSVVDQLGGMIQSASVQFDRASAATTSNARPSYLYPTLFEVEKTMIVTGRVPVGSTAPSFTTNEKTHGGGTLYRHVWVWQPRIEVVGEGLQLPSAGYKLLAWLLEGCSRVVIRSLRDTEDAWMLSCHGYDEKGQLEEPAVARVDKRVVLERESKKVEMVYAQTLGAGVAKITRGPHYLEDWAAALVGIDGACWVLPEFCEMLGEAELLTTLRKRVTLQMNSLLINDGSKSLDSVPGGKAGPSLAASKIPRPPSQASSRGNPQPSNRADPASRPGGTTAASTRKSNASNVSDSSKAGGGSNGSSSSSSSNTSVGKRNARGSQKGSGGKETGKGNPTSVSSEPSKGNPTSVSSHLVTLSESFCSDAFKDLWSAGSPLNVLALETAQRDKHHACAMGGKIESFLKEYGSRLMALFVPPGHPADDWAGYKTPSCISVALRNLDKRVDGAHVKDHARCFSDSFVHDKSMDAKPLENNASQPLAEVLDRVMDLLKPKTRPPGYCNQKPLVTFQHGNLDLDNVLIDARGSVWLTDVAKSGPADPFTDAAAVISTLVFRHFPIKPTMDDIRAADLNTANILVHGMGISQSLASKLQDFANNFSTKEQLTRHLSGLHRGGVDVTALQQLMSQIAKDADVSRLAVQEACAVFDALFGWQGEPPELWAVASREPKSHWSSQAKLIFGLCTNVIRLAVDMVTKCTQKLADGGAEGDGAADLHMSNFLMPLLLRSLQALNTPELGRWHKSIAWYASLQLANTLVAVLPRAPAPLPKPGVEPRQILRLAKGQLLQLHVDQQQRLGGSDGEAKLAIVGLDCETSHEFESLSQLVLPWIAPDDRIERVLREPFNAYKEVPLLSTLANQVDVSETETAAERLRRKLESFHTLLKPCTDHSLKLIDEAEGKFLKIRKTAKEAESDIDALETDANVRLVKINEELQRCKEMLHVDPNDVQARASEKNALKEHKEATRQLEDARKKRSEVRQPLDEATKQYASELTRAVAIDHVQAEAFLAESAPAWSFENHRDLGVLGLRIYGKEQQLNALVGNKWRDVMVHGSETGQFVHSLLDGMQKSYQAKLTPWNHAPCQLDEGDYWALSRRVLQSLRAKHATIVDALSGKRLDVFDQCVPIEVAAADSSSPEMNEALSAIKDVAGLHGFLQAEYSRRVKEGVSNSKACVLLTGPPAAGKSCLMSQLVMHTLGRENSAARKSDPQRTYQLFPLLVKVQELQRALLIKDNRPIFARAWNWIDAYLLCKHGATNEMYFMLRQTLMARKALILLDGIDEGGKARAQIERHVTEVLAPQGHVMLVTSRPAGLTLEAFKPHFQRLEVWQTPPHTLPCHLSPLLTRSFETVWQMKPLRDDQQLTVIKQRVERENVDSLWSYVQNRVPLDTETSQRITGNPLMLSMIVSIYTIRLGNKQNSKSGSSMPSMPETISELYSTAAVTMIERVNRREHGAAVAAAAVLDETKLIEATMFQSHSSLRRVMEEEHLIAAALQLCAPEKLASLQKWPAFSVKERAREGHVVEMVGLGAIKRGVVIRDNGSAAPFKLRFLEDGKVSDWLKQKNVATSKLGEAEFEAEFGDDARRKAITDAAVALPTAMREALDAVKERVRQDRLPLLSFLQGDPLQMQSSHLSFQEFYAAQSICKASRLPGAPPWQWPVWWSNALRLGMEMGDAFKRGLLEASAPGQTSLDLRQKIGGDRPTSLRAVAQLMMVTTSMDLSENRIDTAELALINRSIRDSPTLTDLNLSKNRLGAKGGPLVAEAARASKSLARLSVDGAFLPISQLKSGSEPAVDLSRKALGVASGLVLSALIADNRTLTEVDTRFTGIEAEGAEQLAASVLASNSLLKFSKIPLREIRSNEIESLSLVDQGLGATEGLVLAALLKHNSSLVNLDVRTNPILGKIADKLAAEVLRSSAIQRLSEAPILKLRANELTELDLSGLGLGPMEGRVLASLLKDCTSLETVNLLANRFDETAIGLLLEAKQVAKTITTLCGLKKGQSHMSFKDLTPPCAGLLASDIVTNTSMTQLNLSGNPELGLEGGKSIANGIRENKSLVEVNVDGFPLPMLQLKGIEAVANNKLDLSSKKLGQASAILMASVIGAEATGATALRVLNLRNNSIDDVGLSAISEAITNGAMEWLERLYLNKNQIGNAGLTTFAEAIASRRMLCLKELGISLNRVGDPGLIALANSIRGGDLPSLTMIEVFPNPASAEAQEGLASLVNKRGRNSPRNSPMNSPGRGSSPRQSPRMTRKKGSAAVPPAVGKLPQDVPAEQTSASSPPLASPVPESPRTSSGPALSGTRGRTKHTQVLLVE